MVKFIRYEKVFRLYECIQPYLKYSIPLEDKLPGQNVMVIAPHQDDESIGCSGTIIKHVSSGGTAGVLFCTRENELRDNESKGASGKIGFSKEIFLGYDIESLDKNKKFEEEFAACLKEEKPDCIFIPFFLDNHTDHRAVNMALIEISKKMNLSFMIYSYPVWFPVYPNVIHDISDVWSKKESAIKEYKSQLETRDYVSMAKALSEYWANVKGRKIKKAETFFKASLSEYLSLMGKVFK